MKISLADIETVEEPEFGYHKVSLDEIEEKPLFTPQSIEELIKKTPKALEFSMKDVPSRKDAEDAGIREQLSQEERIELARLIQKNIQEKLFAESKGQENPGPMVTPTAYVGAPSSSGTPYRYPRAKQEGRGMGSEIASAMGLGATQTMSGIGGTVEMAGNLPARPIDDIKTIAQSLENETVDNYSYPVSVPDTAKGKKLYAKLNERGATAKFLKQVGKATSEFYDRLGEHPALQRPKYLQEGTFIDHPERLMDPVYYARVMGENLPNLLAMFLPGAALGKVAKVAGAGAKAAQVAGNVGAWTGAFTMEAGNAYNDAKKEMEAQNSSGEARRSSEEIEKIASVEGALTGLVNAYLETALFREANKITTPIKRTLRQKALKVAKDGFKASGTEGATEFLQEWTQMVSALIGHQPSYDLKYMLGRSGEAALGGALLGGPIGGVSAYSDVNRPTKGELFQKYVSENMPNAQQILSKKELFQKFVSENMKNATLDPRWQARQTVSDALSETTLQNADEAPSQPTTVEQLLASVPNAETLQGYVEGNLSFEERALLVQERFDVLLKNSFPDMTPEDREEAKHSVKAALSDGDPETLKKYEEFLNENQFEPPTIAGEKAPGEIVLTPETMPADTILEDVLEGPGTTEEEGNQIPEDEIEEIPPEEAKTSKEPWEMTREEFAENQGANNAYVQQQRDAIVKQAIKQGKPVPPEVLAEYPDLKPNPSQVGSVEKPVEAVPPVSATKETPEPPKAPQEAPGEVPGGPRLKEGLKESGYLTPFVRDLIKPVMVLDIAPILGIPHKEIINLSKFEVANRILAKIHDDPAKLRRIIDIIKKHDTRIKESEIFESEEEDISPEEKTEEETPDDVLVNKIAKHMEKKGALTHDEFVALADEAYGGTRAEGKWGISDAYDAMEAGINKYLATIPLDPATDLPSAKLYLKDIQAMENDLPVQRNRSGEKETFQQFSTPPSYAYTVNWLARIGDEDVVFEPSAGTGNLAVFSTMNNLHKPKAVYVNELSPRRASLLKHINPTEIFAEDAEQVHNILSDKVKPSVIIMNPPFSRAATRMGDKKVIGTDLKHIDAALKLLQDGGRLVAIMGTPLSGEETQTFKDWYNKTKGTYNIKGNVYVGRDVYKKMGTTFPTRVLMIDKTGPTSKTISKSVDSMEELMDTLEGVRNERKSISTEYVKPKKSKSAPTESTGKTPAGRGGSAGKSGGTILPPTGDLGTGESEGSGSKGVDQPKLGSGGIAINPPTGTRSDTGSTNVQPDNSGRGKSESGTGNAEDVSGTQGGVTENSGGKTSGELPPIDNGEQSGTTVNPPGNIDVKSEETERRAGELTESIFEPYHPAYLVIDGAKAHPASVVESAAMAAVKSPKTTYKLNIPKSIVTKGLLSLLQLEHLVYAGQAHEGFLPGLGGEKGRRRGYMIGDGTGMGKGRSIAGIILDNWMRGRKKAVWVSEKKDLIDDAKRDWGALEQDKDMVFSQKTYDKITAKEGILFIPYSTVRGSKIVKEGEAKISRVDQIVEWLGTDFDGVLVFDEAHNMRNCDSVKGSIPSQAAMSGIELQTRLPNARIVYSSATAATEVYNLGYTEALGLWGPGTAFPKKQNFVSEIGSGGVAAMEIVARELKARGLYLARSIAFNDGTERGTVKYDRIEHTLTEQQHRTYDKICEAWRSVIDNMATSIEETQTNKRTVSRLKAQLWNTQQRFYNILLSSLQIPTVIKGIEADLAAGRSALVQFVNTGESIQNKAKEGMTEDEVFEDLDLSPRQALMQYVQDYFPVNQFEEYVDENGKKDTRQVKDSAGNPVQNKEAVALREKLLDELGSLAVPESPLDQLINHFGADAIAEVTGRKRRLVRRTQPDGTVKMVEEHRTKGLSNKAEIRSFMDKKKRILLFSDAGGTGATYNASLEAINQEQRAHYVVQPGWRADKCLQGMGRSHRTNQAWAPIYHLCQTNLKGHKRFLTSIARRLDQLGALTKGQRETGSTGLFSAADNLESTEAKDALNVFFRQIATGELRKTISLKEFETSTGLKLTTKTGQLQEKLPEITQFLNRLLMLPMDLQNNVFDAYSKILDQRVEMAISLGILDQGIETIRADKIQKVKEKVVYTDKNTSLETKLVTLKVFHKIKLRKWSDSKIQDAVRGGLDYHGFVQSERSGNVYCVEKAGKKTDARTGRVVDQYKLIGVDGYSYINAINIDQNYRDNWRIFTPVEMDEVEQLWNKSVSESPGLKETEENIITGLLLPIWDRIKGIPRIYRLKTDDGEVMIGRVVEKGELQNTLKALKVSSEAPKISAKEAITKLKNGDITIHLVNGWEIRKTRVNKETRIELVGPDYSFEDQLKADGVFKERVNYITRYFIPTDERAIKTYTLITNEHAVADVRYLSSGDVDALVKKDPFDLPVKQVSPGDKPISRHEIIVTMSKLFDVPVRAGKIPGKPASVYLRRPELIRIKEKHLGELDVVSHEIAHHIEKTTDILKNLPVHLKEELGRLDYDPNQFRPREGFAEFIKYLLLTDDAKTMAPMFYDYFTNDWLVANPEIEDKLVQSKGYCDSYRSQNAGDRIKSNISETGKPVDPLDTPTMTWLREKTGDMWNVTYEAMKDEAWFTHLFTEEAKRRGYKPAPGDDPYSIIRGFSQSGPTLANEAIEKGVFLVTGDMRQIGPSLRDVFKNIKPAEYEDFVSWMYARHAIESWAKGKNPGIPLKEAEAWYKQKDNPRWESAAKTFTDFNNALIKMLVDSGVLSKKAGKAIEDSYETYIPLSRVKEIMRRDGMGYKKLVNLPNVLKRRKGSGRQIIDPVQATIERAIRFYTRATQQEAINEMVHVAESVQGMGGWMARVSPGSRKTTFSLQEIKKQLEEIGIELELDELSEDVQNAMLYVWRPDFFYKGSEPIAQVMIDGNPVMYEFDRHLFRGINGMNFFQMPVFMEIAFGTSCRAVKMGATGLSMAFGLKNPLRDYQTYLFQKEEAKGLKSLVTPFSMIGSYVYSKVQELNGNEGDPFVELWEFSGGPLSQILGLDRKMIKKKVGDILNDSTQSRLLNVAKHPVEDLRNLIGISEVGPRLAEYAAVLEKHGYTRERVRALLKQGRRPPRNVLIEAKIAQANVTVDFTRMGYIGKWMNRMIPFWNPAVEGFDKYIRTWAKHPVRQFVYSAILSAITAMYWYDKKDEDWYKEAPDWLKYGFWTFTDNEGKPIIRIPRAQEWGLTISGGTEAILNTINENNPKEILKYGNVLKQTLIPDVVPALVQPATESYFNYDMWRQQPIVNERLSERLPKDQTTEYDTKLVQAIGAWLGVSPSKIEHLLEGYSGGLYRRVEKPIEGIISGSKKEFFAADIPGIGGFALRSDYSESVEDFYDTLKTKQQEYNSAKDAKQELPATQSNQYHRFNEYAELMRNIRNLKDRSQDRDKQFVYDKYLIGLARLGMDKEQLSRYPNVFTDQNVPAGVGEIRDRYLGNKILDATADMPKRSAKESVESYQKRRVEIQERKERAAEELRKIGVTKDPDRMRKLTYEAGKRRGYNTKVLTEDGERTVFGKRLSRINSL